MRELDWRAELVWAMAQEHARRRGMSPIEFAAKSDQMCRGLMEYVVVTDLTEDQFMAEVQRVIEAEQGVKEAEFTPLDRRAG